jgi:hypothetical protein
MSRSLCTLAVLATGLGATEPHVAAAPRRTASAPGDIFVDAGLEAGLARTTTATPDDDDPEPTTRLRVALSADALVTTQLTLGGALALERTAQGDLERWQREVAPRVGLYLPATDALAFWSRASIAYRRTSGERVRELWTLSARIEALSVLYLAEGVFLGFGPSLERDLAAGGDVDWRYTRIGIGTVFGGRF